jgi:hypothetical protein
MASAMPKPKPTEIDQQTVRVVHHIGPHHAEGLERLAGITVSARQGDEFDFIHLDVELNCPMVRRH